MGIALLITVGFALLLPQSFSHLNGKIYDLIVRKNVIAGLWLIIAPFTLKYVYATPRLNDVIVGIIVAGLAIWSSGATAVSSGGRHAHA